MAEEPLLRGRSYVMQAGASTVAATISPLKYKLDIDSLEHLAAEQLELNEIGVCELSSSTSRSRSTRMPTAATWVASC